MAKTSRQIQGDVYRLLKDSFLYEEMNGDIYRGGCRPRDSRKEDAVVVFTTGYADQIQSGVVTVNLFIPDIDPYGNGVYIEDGERVEELERLAQDWVDSLSAEVSCYKFRLQQTIATYQELETNEHFISIKLAYRYFGGDFEPLNIPQYGILLMTEDKTKEEAILTTERDEAILSRQKIHKQTKKNN